MAMMMTGRVLLVCALCVLWCGAGGRCDGGETAGSGSGGGPPPESKEIETSPQVKQELKDEARSVKGKKPPTSSEDEVEEDEKEDNDDDDDDEPEEEKEKSKEKEDAQQTRKSKSSSKEVAPLTIPKASGLSEAGGGSPSGVDGVGSSESSGGSEDLNLEVSAPVVNFPPLLPNAAAGGLQNTDGALSSQKNNFSETGVHSGTTPPAPSLPKSQAPAITKPEAEEQSSTEQDTEDSPDTEEVTTGKENVQNTVETGIPSRSSSAASKPPVQLTTPILTQSPAVALPERSALAPS
ncbi:mucin-associated surface protein (MASP), partial [Trypanosoma cruzi]